MSCRALSAVAAFSSLRPAITMLAPSEAMPFGHAQPDAAIAAGHDRDFSLEIEQVH